MPKKRYQTSRPKFNTSNTISYIRLQSNGDTMKTFHNAEQAYYIARQEGPNDDTRQACLSDPEYAYRYAKYVDKHPRDDTIQVSLSNPGYAYSYALDIDKKPRNDTRQATLFSPVDAYYYALYIDKHPRDDTRQVTQNSIYFISHLQDVCRLTVIE